MAFPQTILPLVTEILIDGAWVDVTSDRLIEGGLTITRGRQDWGSRVVASRCSQAFWNPTGTYSNRNPASIYFGKLGRGTQIRHRIRWVRATFSGSAASSWATTDTGQAWTNSGGVASNYAENSGVGKHVLTTVNVTRNSSLTAPVAVNDITATVSVSAIATGDTIYVGPAIGSDTSNLYQARLRFLVDGFLQLEVLKRVGGTQTTLNTSSLGEYTAGQRWSVRFQRTAHGLLRAAAWLESSNPAYTTWNIRATDTDLTGFGVIFMRSISGAANTNVNPEIHWDNVEVNDHRFHGELSASAPAWDLSGRKVTAPFEAAGILQRLSSGNPPAPSALRRTVLSLDPIAYFPLEDLAGTTQFASALSGATAVTTNTFGGTGSVEAAGDSTIVGSLPVAAIPSGGTSLDVPIPDYTESGSLTVVVDGRIPSADANGFFIEVSHANGVTTTISIEAALNIIIVDASDDTTSYWSDSELTSVSDVVGRWIQVDLTGFQLSGIWTLRIRDDQGTTLRTLTGTSAAAYAKVTNVRVTTFADVVTDESPVGLGHVQVYNEAIDPETTARALGGWDGETAAERMERVCSEAGITFSLLAVSDETSLVGPQPTATTPEILFRAAEADQGILYEPRDALGLVYRPIASLYNQAGLSLDYTAGEVAPPFLPTEDDQLLLNDVTAQRYNGSSARITVTNGPLGTETVGTFGEDESWNVSTDDQLLGLATWRSHLGTWDEARYPALTVNLAAPDVAADTSLTGTVAAVDLGDRVTVGNLPVWLPPDDVSLLVEGSSEYFGDGKQWSVTWNCVPAGPWDVGVYGVDPGGVVTRYDSGDSTLSSGVNSSATSLSVAWTLLGWTHADGDFDIRIGNERMTVTAVSGSSSPQTFTVTRATDGSAAAHDAGDSVALWDTPRYAL